MRLILVSGNYHGIIAPYIEEKFEIINDKSLELENLNDYIVEIESTIDCILLTDHAFSNLIEKEKEQLLILKQWLIKNSCPIVYMTNDFMSTNIFVDLFKDYQYIKYVVYDWIRPSSRIIKSVFTELASISNKKGISISNNENEKPKRKKPFLEFLKNTQHTKNMKPKDGLTREFENIGLTISRVIAITGHRSSGVTTTSINIAYGASKRGLKTIIIDLDIEYRSLNMYFSKYNEMTQKDDTINSSLIRSLAKPQDFKSTAFCINDNLWLVSLGYSFSDQKLLEQFYNSSKLISMLSVLRNNFNLVIIDMPLDVFSSLTEAMLHIDIFGLCVSNNLYSILNTIRKLECVLDNDKVALLKSKSSLIVSKYNVKSKFNGDFFTPDKVNEILTSGLSNSFIGDIKIAGNIPYCEEFDKQIESDIPISDTNIELKEKYDTILLRLMGG